MLSTLKRLLGDFGIRPEDDTFLSKFGGLWIDRANAKRELARRVKRRKLSRELAAKIDRFIEDGYVVLPKAVEPVLVDRIAALVDSAYAHGDERLRYHTDGTENHIPRGNTNSRGKRIVEAHAVLPEVRNALRSPHVSEFLSAIFDEPSVLTQTLIFQTGSEQSFHQDPVFVPYDEPLRMAAAWIALEDIQDGSGELQYMTKSHRLPDYVFSTGRRDSHGAQPGEVDNFTAWLMRESDGRSLKRERFGAKKGDVLIWHAGLAHGGSPITKPSATRRSLVGHFCPETVHPRYPGADVRLRDGDLWYSSYLYDLTTL